MSRRARRGFSALIVGAGYVGRRLLEALPREEASALSRSGGDRGDSGRVRRLDLDRDEEVGIDSPHRDAIVYTVPPASDHDGDRRLQAFLERLAFVPRRIVYLSTTGVYGDRGGAVVDESAAPAPQSARARRRVAAEALLGDYCTRYNVKLVVLRVPGIYGPGRLGIGRIEAGQPLIAEDEANPGNRIHVDDLVAACIAAMAGDVPAGVYNVGDGDERSSTWFAFEVARQAGLPAPPTVSRAAAECTFSPRRLSFLRESRRLELEKMRKVLKVDLNFPDAADGIAASLDRWLAGDRSDQTSD